MKRFCLVLVFAAACGQSTYLPDGGRPRQVCQNAATTIGVTTQDLMGQPVSGATVVARNTTNGKRVTGTTGGNGRTGALTDDIGTGQIEITATSGALQTRQPFIVQVTCGDCDCSAMPSYATLTLQ